MAKKATCKHCGGKLEFIGNIWIHSKNRQRLCPQGKGVGEPK